MKNEKEIREDIRRIIRKYSYDTVDFNDDTDLVTEKILSSYGFINVLVEIESLVGDEIDFDNINISNLYTINSIINVLFSNIII